MHIYTKSHLIFTKTLQERHYSHFNDKKMEDLKRVK
jgi:hypothetical protein